MESGCNLQLLTHTSNSALAPSSCHLYLHQHHHKNFSLKQTFFYLDSEHQTVQLVGCKKNPLNFCFVFMHLFKLFGYIWVSRTINSLFSLIKPRYEGGLNQRYKRGFLDHLFQDLESFWQSSQLQFPVKHIFLKKSVLNALTLNIQF